MEVPERSNEQVSIGVRGGRPPIAPSIPRASGRRYKRSEVAFVYFIPPNSKPAIRTVRGDLEIGGKIYERRCLSCHGAEGQGNPQPFSSRRSWKAGTFEQMRKFRSGDRGYDREIIREESGRGKEFSDTDLRNLVAYCIDAFGLEEAKGANGDSKFHKPVLHRVPN